MISREQAQDMADAHAEGLHADLPREGCPECEGADIRDYPTQDTIDEDRYLRSIERNAGRWLV